jgi:serine/threonine-protein kinase
MLRIAEIEGYKYLQSDARWYEHVAAAGINVMRLVGMDIFHGGTLAYQLFTWFDGEDVWTALQRMSHAEQFATGYKAGAVLRKIHALPLLYGTEPWGIRFKRKMQEKIQFYNDKPIKFREGDLIVRYLQDNQELLDNRPQTFTHGDWNTENLMFCPDGQIGIIDLSGEHDYGDPWWGFWLIPHDLNSSAHFYTGQIKGYFEGEPPMEYFRLFSYYLAFSTLEFLCDYTGEDDPENVRTVLSWFDDMRNPVPTWYLRDYHMKAFRN